MRPCQWYRLELPGLLMGELRHEERRRVCDHLVECDPCRCELERLWILDAFLERSLPPAGNAPDLPGRFAVRLAVEGVESVPVRPRPPRVRESIWIPLAAAATLAGLLLARSPAPEEPFATTPPLGTTAAISVQRSQGSETAAGAEENTSPSALRSASELESARTLADVEELRPLPITPIHVEPSG